jgi:hypothetical protein
MPGLESSIQRRRFMSGRAGGGWVGGRAMRLGGCDWEMWAWPGTRVDKFHLTYDGRIWVVID